jgi:multiple sugar transport system ATP-binding protein
VIHRGRLHQVGTPQELYDDPVDLFVAGFIGDPPMNLFNLGEVILGARPEDILTMEEAGSDALALKLDIEVEHLEFLGSEWLIYGTVRGGIPEDGRPPRVITRVRQGGRPGHRAGERHSFVIKKASARFFDRQTGQRSTKTVGPVA